MSERFIVDGVPFDVEPASRTGLRFVTSPAHKGILLALRKDESLVDYARGCLRDFAELGFPVEGYKPDSPASHEPTP